MSDVVNVRVKVTNLLDQSIVGFIHSFNPSQSVLALKMDPSKIRIINTAFVKAVQHPKLSKVDIRKLEADLNESIARYKPVEETEKSTTSSEKPAHEKQHTSKHHQSHQPNRQHSKRRDSTSHGNANASTIFNSLVSKFGKENVQWLPNDSINVFKDVVIAKPYTLNKMGGKRSPKAEEVRNALREILLDVGPGKRGG
ncbi:hypothetical protein CXQ85_001238 [Candidozyma haemuli]|uniref:AD domain-containing protein n=1 Tax=Candidozyma haemuli TaxID=45357 RepID=A0A2V1AN10_9ASCO|nr:hypothetical protein CXQ85_001238 [[Candida] haemuloni]PVH18946.1 hypothetical protein CXQ85_001238 [[Candida] haemuloni]